LDISLKQRLVGASVLVALGVIFIPMILERGADDESLTVRMEIPPKPDVEFKNRLDDAPAVEEIEWPESVEEATAEIRAENSADQPAAAGLPQAVRPAEPEATPLAPKPASKSQPTPTKTAKPAATPQQWIVQLGSFSKETNALVLQDKLRAKGLKPLIKATDTPAGRVYRVRLGPMPNRTDAEEMVIRIKKEMELSAIVMAYPDLTVIP
jgi:DedD protein